MTRIMRVFGAVLTLLLIVGLSIAAVAQEATPSVTVSDQDVESGTVTVDQVVAVDPGWMDIHADDNGSPGPIIGFSPVEPGTNDDVVVELDMDQATPTLYAMLHVDLGTRGTHEFPGPDLPVQVDGQVVVQAFEVELAQVTGTPGATPGATAAVTATAETPAAGATPRATVTGQPETLPETGASSWALMLIVGGAAALLGGLTLASNRRVR